MTEAHPVHAVERLSAKLYLALPVGIEAREVVPVLHRWIQQSVLDELMIDVASYEHVQHGPSVLLVAHAANYVLDEGDGRMGLVCQRKRDLRGDLAERLATVTRATAVAARHLEREPSLAGRARFRTDELRLQIHDRLLGPNDAATWDALLPSLSAFAQRVWGGAAVEVARVSEDPRALLGARLVAAHAPTLDEVIGRLGSG